MPLIAKGLPFPLPLLGVALAVAILEVSVVGRGGVGVVQDPRDGGVGGIKGTRGYSGVIHR